MSTAMELIKRANREEKGITIVVSASKEMGSRIPIRVRYKSTHKKEIQETAHHGEELTLDVDLSGGINRKVAYVCDQNRTKVKVAEFLFTDSVKDGQPAYAFLSVHVYTSIDELEFPEKEKVQFAAKTEQHHYMSEW